LMTEFMKFICALLKDPVLSNLKIQPVFVKLWRTYFSPCFEAEGEAPLCEVSDLTASK
jgi:hypothetical protein